MRTALWLAVRTGTALLTLLAVSVLVFAASRALPGSYAQLALGPYASADDRAQVTADLGLDDGLPTQLVRWLGTVLQGDLGTSFVTHRPVATELAERLPITAGIAAIALVLTIAIGVPLGFLATRSRGRSGPAGRLVSALGISLPEFVVGSAVVFVVSRYGLGLTIGGSSADALLLPGAVLAVFGIAATARATRDAVLQVSVEPYVAASVARGATAWQTVRRHVLRNASIPVLTVTSTILASLLGGTVIVENVFDVPGLGSYLITALDRRDYLVVQAGTLLVATIFITTSLVVDLLAGWLDPRLRAQLTGVGR
ncbi:ABC transporter permease [Cryptosporangium aurantiacum]|uniref:Peptide/nickel transport system permease protein n=1 Tax=Cryptosporangium aurantiacum TaxID=134849 RepID=A0A1M7HAG6_9ACTN|nr:ABC transporter permease [Cryptosporangium aurantiacum]SHM25582.1 peptide/nickel transport system permease protein [Cryptosporangium aurantiacum]